MTVASYPGLKPNVVSSRLSPRVAAAVPKPSSVLGFLAIGALGVVSALKRQLK